MYPKGSLLLTLKSLILFSKYNPIIATATKVVENAMIPLSDNTRSLLTAMFFTTARIRFSAAEVDLMAVDEKQDLGNQAKRDH